MDKNSPSNPTDLSQNESSQVVDGGNGQIALYNEGLKNYVRLHRGVAWQRWKHQLVVVYDIYNGSVTHFHQDWRKMPLLPWSFLSKWAVTKGPWLFAVI